MNTGSLDGTDTVIHELKNPLSVILRTSNAIFDISDLTSEELHEYLRQIRSSAYKMHEIIDKTVLPAEVS